VIGIKAFEDGRGDEKNTSKIKGNTTMSAAADKNKFRWDGLTITVGNNIHLQINIQKFYFP